MVGGGTCPGQLGSRSGPDEREPSYSLGGSSVWGGQRDTTDERRTGPQGGGEELTWFHYFPSISLPFYAHLLSVACVPGRTQRQSLYCLLSSII